MAINEGLFIYELKNSSKLVDTASMIKYSFFIFMFVQAVVAADFNLSEMEEVKAKLNSSVNAPGQNCIACEHDQESLSQTDQVDLDSNKKKIKTDYRGGSKPHIIYLVRTQNSPDQVKLKTRYYQRYCAQPFSRRDFHTGRLLSYRCLVYKSEEREETIRINFKNAPSLGPDQKEIYQIKLNKELDEKDIQHQLSFVQGPKENIKIESEKSFFGLFGERYSVQ